MGRNVRQMIGVTIIDRHYDFQKEIVEKTFVLNNDDVQFPQLNIGLNNPNIQTDDIKENKFKDALKIEFPQKIEVENKHWAGYTVFNTKNKTWKTYDKNGIVVFPENYKKYQKDKATQISSDDIMKVYEQMSANWCKYYDEINELVGDISPYIDYKNEIQKLVDEDNAMFNELYGNDGNISSDDELYANDDEFY